MPRTGPRVKRCRKCGSIFVKTLDGAKVTDCFPGIKYEVCDGCGHITPTRTRRPRPEKLS